MIPASSAAEVVVEVAAEAVVVGAAVEAWAAVVAAAAWAAAVPAAWQAVVAGQAAECHVRPAVVLHRSVDPQRPRVRAAAWQAARDLQAVLVPAVLVRVAVPSIDHRKD
jgi:hypothetical protein